MTCQKHRQKEESNMNRTSFFITSILVGIFIVWQGSGSLSFGRLMIGMGAEIQADAETVLAIEKAFNRAEEAIGSGNLQALMQIYSDHYRYKSLSKKDMRNIWKDFLEKYHRIATSHSFSRIVVKKGEHPTAEVTCTGSLWATTNKGERVNLASWLGNVHYLVYEEGAWRIKGQGRYAPNPSHFGQGPPPLF